MVLVPVLAFWYFDSVSILAQDITGTGIKNTVPIKGICAFWFGTNNNTIIGRLQ
jgi:hypothetical protein